MINSYSSQSCTLFDADIKTEVEKCSSTVPMDLSNNVVYAEEIIEFTAFGKLISCATPFNKQFYYMMKGFLIPFQEEGSFGKLALVKIHLRTSMIDKRLGPLCLLNVNSY